MLEKFKNKYTIKSARLKGYDYSQNGMYFVTICTKDRQEFFGKIKNKKIILSDIGKIANKYWREIPKHFPFVNLDEYIVMPNHIHGIIEIINTSSFCRDAINRVSTIGGGVTKKHNPMGKNTLGEIIRWYKGRCKFEINKTISSSHFQWQSRFYDHIIRNNKSLNKIREYIQINPQMWEKDKNNLENLYA